MIVFSLSLHPFAMQLHWTVVNRWTKRLATVHWSFDLHCCAHFHHSHLQPFFSMLATLIEDFLFLKSSHSHFKTLAMFSNFFMYCLISSWMSSRHFSVVFLYFSIHSPFLPLIFYVFLMFSITFLMFLNPLHYEPWCSWLYFQNLPLNLLTVFNFFLTFFHSFLASFHFLQQTH